MGSQTVIASGLRQAQALAKSGLALLKIPLREIGDGKRRVGAGAPRPIGLAESGPRLLGELNRAGGVPRQRNKTTQDDEQFDSQSVVFRRRRQGLEQIFVFLPSLFAKIQFP